MRVAFLGDSLTEGWPGAAYFPLLRKRFAQHELLNHGRAGDTVRDLLRRMRREGLQPVDLAFLWVGANDAVSEAWGTGGGCDWEERLARIRGDYEDLLGWAATRSRHFVVVLPIILEAEGSLWERRAVELGAVAADLAARRGARVVDLAPAFAAARTDGEPFTIDGVHLTDAGAAVVANAFATVIESAAPCDTASDSGGLA